MTPRILAGSFTDGSMAHLAFDIDGTIYDCGDIVADAFQEGIQQYSRHVPDREIPIPSRERILELVGIPTAIIFQELFPQLSSTEHRILNDRCTAALSRMVRSGGGTLIEGVSQTLEGLHREQHRLLIASNGRREYIESILETYTER